MIEDIYTFINTKPSVPFTIHTADGSAFRIPTVDHVAGTLDAKRVFGDDGGYNVLSALLIAHVSVDHGEPAA